MTRTALEATWAMQDLRAYDVRERPTRALFSRIAPGCACFWARLGFQGRPLRSSMPAGLFQRAVGQIGRPGFFARPFSFCGALFGTFARDAPPLTRRCDNRDSMLCYCALAVTRSCLRARAAFLYLAHIAPKLSCCHVPRAKWSSYGDFALKASLACDVGARSPDEVPWL